MQKKVWMTTYLFKQQLGFLFYKSIIGGFLKKMTSSDSKWATQALEQVVEVGLDMVTLPTYTWHALQPLNVSCFKPFKTTFRKERSSTMVKNNHLEPNKVTLTTWVDKALQQPLKKENIKLRFKVSGI